MRKLASVLDIFYLLNADPFFFSFYPALTQQTLMHFECWLSSANRVAQAENKVKKEKNMARILFP